MRTGSVGFAIALALAFAPSAHAGGAVPATAAAPQYDSTRVYVRAEIVGRFANTFIATFGGTCSKQIVASVLVAPFASDQRTTAMVEFPGGYIAEIHAPARP
jgi:hypothetical protein